MRGEEETGRESGGRKRTREILRGRFIERGRELERVMKRERKK